MLNSDFIYPSEEENDNREWTYCPKCGEIIFEDEEVCSNCKYEKE